MQTQSPIIVRIVEEPVRGTTIAEVLIGVVGLIGALIIAAAVLGLIFGGILIAIKRLRARFNLEPVPDGEALRVTPEFVRMEGKRLTPGKKLQSLREKLEARS